jgi:hypothetical protein
VNNCGISDIEVVSAFEAYKIEHRDGVLGSQEEPAEILFRKGGRLLTECHAACVRAIKRGLVQWPLNVRARGPTETGRALLKTCSDAKH